MSSSVVDVAVLPTVWGIDGETIEMKPGRYVLVAPESKRGPAAGPDGMSFLVIGGVPGDVYEPWTPPEQ